MAMNTRRIGKKNTDIVQHGSLIHELLVKPQLGMTTRQFQSEISHCPGVQYVNIFQFIIQRIVAVDYHIHIHSKRSFSSKPMTKISKIETTYKPYTEWK